MVAACKWLEMTVEQKVRTFENKILNHLDAACQAFDLEEVMSCGFSDKDRLLCWNAAMNLVEDKKVHLIQVRERFHHENLRWIIIGFEYEVLTNFKYHPPGPITKE